MIHASTPSAFNPVVKHPTTIFCVSPLVTPRADSILFRPFFFLSPDILLMSLWIGASLWQI